MQARDVYKLIHQGVFGPGHIITSAAAARQALSDELWSLRVKGQEPRAKAQRSDEELIETIDPNDKLVRVNLRPMMKKGGRMRDEGGTENADWLADALVESSRLVRGDPRQMKQRLAAAVRWCRRYLPQQAAELERLAAEAEESGYPAFHHSPAYGRAYRPAYRAVLRTCVRKGEL